MNSVIITKDLDIQLNDLTLNVDVNVPFTLRDVLRAIVSSSAIDIEAMSAILRCNCIQELWEECEALEYEPISDSIDRLQLTWMTERFKIVSEKTEWSSSFWDLTGVGPGNVEMNVDLSPTYRLSDLPITFNPNSEVHFIDDQKFLVKYVDFRPSITLVDLMYWICWHLSLFGGPESRNSMIDNFVKEIRQMCLNRMDDQFVVQSQNHRIKGND